MHHFRILIASLLGIVGCADSTTIRSAEAPAFGPHGGPLIELPGKSGFVEIVAEPVPNPKAGGDGVLAVYVLTPDLKGTLSPLPTDVSLSIRPPGAEARRRSRSLRKPSRGRSSPPRGLRRSRGNS